MRRSPGVAVAKFAGGAIVYDAVADKVHRLGTVAACLLLGDDSTLIDDLIDDVAAAAGVAREAVTADVVAGVESMRSLGLLNRREPLWVPDPVGGSALRADGRPTSATHIVHDRRIVFRSQDRLLLNEIDSYLGATVTPPTGAAVTHSNKVVFDVEPDTDGRVRLHAAEEWDFPNRDSFLIQLPGVLNDFAARSHTLAVLHAGGVRTPSGRVLLIAGAAESGKSTLVGALVQQGCDYLGDEMIGLRSDPLEALPYPKPLELDETSCEVLGVKSVTPPYIRHNELRNDAAASSSAIGPISEIVLPEYQAGHPIEIVRLDPDDAAKALLGQTLNLDRVREVGLRTVCGLAEKIPVTCIAHGDSVGLATALIGAEDTLAIGF